MSFAEEVKEANSGADTIEAEALDRLSNEIGRWAEDKGCREDWDRARDLDEFANAYATTGASPVAQKRAEILHEAADALRTNIIGTKLALAHSELSEALESLRNTGYKGHAAGEGNFGEEIADTIIRMLELSDMIGTSVGKDVMQKVIKNRTRPHMHGRKM